MSIEKPRDFIIPDEEKIKIIKQGFAICPRCKGSMVILSVRGRPSEVYCERCHISIRLF